MNILFTCFPMSKAPCANSQLVATFESSCGHLRDCVAETTEHDGAARPRYDAAVTN